MILNISLIILTAIVIILIITAIILCISASNEAEKECSGDNAIKIINYLNYSVICSTITIVLIGISILVYVFYNSNSGDCPIKIPDNTKELVNNAAAALQKHAEKLEKHANIINSAFATISPIAANVGQTCENSATKTCPIISQKMGPYPNAQNVNFGWQAPKAQNNIFGKLFKEDQGPKFKLE